MCSHLAQHKSMVINYRILFIQISLLSQSHFPIPGSHAECHSIQPSQLLRLSMPLTIFQMSPAFGGFNYSEDLHTGILQNLTHQSGLWLFRWKVVEVKDHCHHVIKDKGYHYDFIGVLDLDPLLDLKCCDQFLHC